MRGAVCLGRGRRFFFLASNNPYVSDHKIENG